MKNKNQQREIHTRGYDGVDRREENSEWHANKNYQLSIIFLLISNISATVWWAGNINSDVEQLKSQPVLTERIVKLETTVELHNQYFSRLNETLMIVNKTVNRIDKEQSRIGGTLEAQK